MPNATYAEQPRAVPGRGKPIRSDAAAILLRFNDAEMHTRDIYHSLASRRTVRV